jgi:type IV secretion system protein VirD4
MKNFLYHCYLWVSRITHFLSTVKHLHTSRWALPHELKSKNLLSDELDGRYILIGEGIFNHVLAVKPTETRKELGNILFDGMTRAGKGLAIEANLLNWSYSAIVNDIKKELWLRTAGFREKGLGGKAFLFDPTGRGHKFDPLEGKFTDSDLRSVATTLLYRPNEGENKVFTGRAITMLTQIFHAARLEKQRPLPFTYKILNEGLIGVVTILEIISQKHNFYPNLATKFLDIGIDDADFKDKFLLSCFGTLCERINALLTKENIECFNGSDFTAKDIIRSEKPITVYLHWAERDLLALSPLIQLILNSLFDGMIDAYDNVQGDGCQPVAAFLDEIFRTGMSKLPKYATTVCGRNISLLVTSQCKAQMDAEYGQYKAKELKAQFTTQIRYCPADKDTAKDIEEDLDYQSGFARSLTEYESGTSQGENEQKIPLMPAHEIRLMDMQEIIGFRAGIRLRPFRARRMDWRRFPVLAQRQRIPPPQLAVLPQLDELPPHQASGSTRQEPSWRLSPDLLRWGNPPASVNGLRKKRFEDGKGWA